MRGYCGQSSCWVMVTVNRCNSPTEKWLIPLIYDNRSDTRAHTNTANVSLNTHKHTHTLVFLTTILFTFVISVFLVNLTHFFLTFLSIPPRSRTQVQKGGTPGLLSPVHYLQSSPALRPVWDTTTMDRSVQELFLNFMIVLITVLLMWLLVKTYQDWTMGATREEMNGRGRGDGGKPAWLL